MAVLGNCPFSLDSGVRALAARLWINCDFSLVAYTGK